MANLKQILESLIFTSGKPIEVKKLTKFTTAHEEEVKKAILELQNDYKNQQRGLALILQGNEVQMTCASESGEAVKKLVTSELQEDLSRAALETLTIIAYRGPITRAAIEVIRGVNCVYILRSLLIRGLVTKMKSEKDSRRSVYEVSFDFLRYLGIVGVKDLPDFEKLSKEVSFEEYIKEAEVAATKQIEDKKADSSRTESAK